MNQIGRWWKAWGLQGLREGSHTLFAQCRPAQHLKEQLDSVQGGTLGACVRACILKWCVGPCCPSFEGSRSQQSPGETA